MAPNQLNARNLIVERDDSEITRLIPNLETTTNEIFSERGLRLHRPASGQPVWQNFDYAVLLQSFGTGYGIHGEVLGRMETLQDGPRIIIYEIVGIVKGSRGNGNLPELMQNAYLMDLELTRRFEPTAEYPFLRTLRTSDEHAHETYMKKSDLCITVPAAHENTVLYKPPSYHVHFYGVGKLPATTRDDILAKVASHLARLPAKFEKINL